MLIALVFVYLAARGVGHWIAAGFIAWMALTELMSGNVNAQVYARWPLGALLNLRWLLPAIAVGQMVRTSPSRWRAHSGAVGLALLALLTSNLPVLSEKVPLVGMEIPTACSIIGVFLLFYATGTAKIPNVAVWRPNRLALGVLVLACVYGLVMFGGRFLLARDLGPVHRNFTDIGLAMGMILALLPFREMSRVLLAGGAAMTAFLCYNYASGGGVAQSFPMLFGLASATGVVSVGIVMAEDDTPDGVASAVWGASFPLWMAVVTTVATVYMDHEDRSGMWRLAWWWVYGSIFVVILAMLPRLKPRLVSTSKNS